MKDTSEASFFVLFAASHVVVFYIVCVDICLCVSVECGCMEIPSVNFNRIEVYSGIFKLHFST